MPIYEYSCPKCGEFEMTQRITEGPLKKCPTCKSKVRKLISSTSFQLKGSGWYATDYGVNKAAAKDAGKDTGTETGKDASKETGKDAGKETGKEASASSNGDAAKSASSDSKPKESSTKTKKDTAAKAA
jgi:putative FmdB family regulatory protein